MVSVPQNFTPAATSKVLAWLWDALPLDSDLEPSILKDTGMMLTVWDESRNHPLEFLLVLNLVSSSEGIMYDASIGRMHALEF